MNRIGWAGTMLAAALFVLSSVPASAQEYYARLSGFQEVGPLPGPTSAETGAILSTGEGTLKLILDKTAQTLTYTLTYSFPDLPAGTEVLQSHIHFGKEHVPGGIMVFFCTNLNPPAAPAAVPPACPSPSGTVTGTGKTALVAADVVGPTGQNVTAGDFAALVAALTSDTAYVNIHTTTFPGGEIRGQIHPVERHHRGSGGGGYGHGSNENNSH